MGVFKYNFKSIFYNVDSCRHIWSIDHRDQILQSIKYYLCIYIKKKKKPFVGIIVILISVLRFSYSQFKFGNHLFTKTKTKRNYYTYYICAYLCIPCVDIYIVLREHTHIRTLYTYISILLLLLLWRRALWTCCSAVVTDHSRMPDEQNARKFVDIAQYSL